MTEEEKIIEQFLTELYNEIENCEFQGNDERCNYLRKVALTIGSMYSKLYNLKEENRKLRKCHLQYEEMTGIDLLLEERN